MQDKIIQLLTRAKLFKINSRAELSVLCIRKVESELHLKLSQDFKILCKFYRYDTFLFFDFYNLTSEGGVIGTTKAWRENINLPHNYLVLSDDGTSSVLMKIEDDKSSVIWCSLEDVLNICDNLPMQYNPTIFPTFADFYSFLLDEEEKIRAEEKARSNS